MHNAPSKIPDQMIDLYTMDGQVQTMEKYYNECYGERNYYWPLSAIDEFLSVYTPQNFHEETIKGQDPRLATNLISIAEELNIHGKKIAVVGSQMPWIECLFHNLGNDVTTVRTRPTLNSEQFKTTLFHEFEEDIDKYDIIISHHSTEHAGLGRYGDSLDPDGDVREMRAIYESLTDDGSVIWIGSAGMDSLIWNSNRVYGEIRLQKIFQGFIEEQWIYQPREEHLNLLLGEHEQAIVILGKDPQYNV